eukprot:6558629-Pyramimonas_sp.AAC.1
MAWDCWLTERGMKLDLHDIGSATLKKIVNQSTQRRLLREVPLSRSMEGLTGPPSLEPAKRLITQLRAQQDYK